MPEKPAKLADFTGWAGTGVFGNFAKYGQNKLTSLKNTDECVMLYTLNNRFIKGLLMKNIFRKFLIILAVFTLSACGYNQFQTKDEAVNAAWAEVLNQYQRRADLIPNPRQYSQGIYST